MYCTKCGTKLNDGDFFCADCGTQAFSHTPTPTAKPDIPDEPLVNLHKPTASQHQANGNTPAEKTENTRNAEKTETTKKKKSGDPAKVVLIILLALSLVYIVVLRFGSAERQDTASSDAIALFPNSDISPRTTSTAPSRSAESPDTNLIPDGIWAKEDFIVLWDIVGDTYGVYQLNPLYDNENFSRRFGGSVDTTNLYIFHGRGRYSISGDIMTTQINNETHIFHITERSRNSFMLEEERFGLLIVSSVSELVDLINEADSE